MKLSPISCALRKLPLLLFAVTTGGCPLLHQAGCPLLPHPCDRSNSLGWAFADFDGDNQPDLATTRMQGRDRYSLQLDSARGGKKDCTAKGAFPALPSSILGLHLTPRDVDGDHDLDIVITSGLSYQPVAVWINDGTGQFEEGDLAAYAADLWHEDPSLLPQRSRVAEQWLAESDSPFAI